MKFKGVHGTSVGSLGAGMGGWVPDRSWCAGYRNTQPFCSSQKALSAHQLRRALAPSLGWSMEATPGHPGAGGGGTITPGLTMAVRWSGTAGVRRSLAGGVRGILPITVGRATVAAVGLARMRATRRYLGQGSRETTCTAGLWRQGRQPWFRLVPHLPVTRDAYTSHRWRWALRWL